MLYLSNKEKFMKEYFDVVIKAIITMGLVMVLLVWFIDIQLDSWLMILISTLTVLLGIGKVIWDFYQKRKELQSGNPREDEFTLQAEVFAGNKAFRNSMYLWLFIFIFHYRIPSPEMMLGIGVLGSGAIYGYWLWYYRSTGEFADEK
jgi:hypothetical protein